MAATMPVPPPPQANRVFKGILTDVYQWPQAMYDGSTRTFECYVRHDTVAMIPFLDAQTLLLTHQEQPGRSAFWDVPGGRVDDGETLEQAVEREFHEETGYQAERVELWTMRRYEGLSHFEEGIYVATGLTPGAFDNHDRAGEKITLHPTPWKEALLMAARGELRRHEVALALLGMAHDPIQAERLNGFLSGTG
jgi:ADP-ribose pyrophosphatase